MVKAKGLGVVPELHEVIAFEKGVEWFVEIFFFYGFLTFFAIVELNREEKAKIDLQNKLTHLLKSKSE